MTVNEIIQKQLSTEYPDLKGFKVGKIYYVNDIMIGGWVTALLGSGETADHFFTVNLHNKTVTGESGFGDDFEFEPMDGTALFRDGNAVVRKPVRIVPDDTGIHVYDPDGNEIFNVPSEAIAEFTANSGVLDPMLAVYMFAANTVFGV